MVKHGAERQFWIDKHDVFFTIHTAGIYVINHRGADRQKFDSYYNINERLQCRGCCFNSKFSPHIAVNPVSFEKDSIPKNPSGFCRATGSTGGMSPVNMCARAASVRSDWLVAHTPPLAFSCSFPPNTSDGRCCDLNNDARMEIGE